MVSVEGMYLVSFGDVAVPTAPHRNGGVVVLETQRIFGGDSGYYYIGDFSIKDSHFVANVRIEKHDPNWISAFGDASQSFKVKVQGTVGNGVIHGYMERLDMLGLRLPVRLLWKEALP